MKEHLNWTFDYNRNQETGVDFSSKIYEILNGYQVSDYWNTASYAILPNFRYNHQNPNIRSNKDLILGELTICRDKKGDRWNYKVHGFDSTSGCEYQVEFLTAEEERRPLQEEWLMTSLKPVTCSVTGTLKDGKIDVVQKRDGNGQLALSNQDYSGSVISCYALIDLFASGRTIDGTFTLIDDSNNIIKDAQIQFVEEDEMAIDGKNLRIRGYCVFGKGFPPTYYWVDPEGRVIIITSRLLTYVLK